METDWEVEVGGDAPVIDGCWPGLVDLRGAPQLARRLPEAKELPALADALCQLNSGLSPVWTSKCDVWSPAEFDADELDARGDEANKALACYIDLLPHRDALWRSPEQAVAQCRGICDRLRNVPLRCCRADLIVRQAHSAPYREHFGITVYITACGRSLADAQTTLESALGAFAMRVLPVDRAASADSKLQ
jgi:hypothetical protein